MQRELLLQERAGTIQRQEALLSSFQRLEPPISLGIASCVPEQAMSCSPALDETIDKGRTESYALCVTPV